MAADAQLAPGDVEIRVVDGKKEIRGLAGHDGWFSYDAMVNFMQKAIAADKARQNESTEAAEERAYVEFSERHYGISREAIR